MRAWFIALRDKFRDSFVVLPGVMALLATALGLVMPYVDDRFAWLAARNDAMLLIFDAGPDGARSVLSAIAGSSITVAATVFSITIAILALTSQQYGPRLLRTFTSDRGVQFALGTFVATFLYPLIVLRTVRTGEDNAFVPRMSVTVGVLLALVSVAVLIYFIDRLSKMIRAPQIIAAVGRDLHEVIDQEIPADASLGDSDEEYDELCGDGLPSEDDAPAVVARRCGYVTVVDLPTLVKHAVEQDTVYRLAVSPGTYVHEGMPLAHMSPRADLPAETRDGLLGAFSFADHRTVVQDVGFGVNQIVEVALRAMSPGINDPFTADTCVDRLTAMLARMAGRAFPDPRWRDEQGKVRVLMRRPTFAYFVAATYAPVRRYARSDAMLLGKMLASMASVARHCPQSRPRRLAAVREQAKAVMDAITDDTNEADKAMLRAAYEAFQRAADHDAGKWARQAVRAED